MGENVDNVEPTQPIGYETEFYDKLKHIRDTFDNYCGDIDQQFQVYADQWRQLRPDLEQVCRSIQDKLFSVDLTPPVDGTQQILRQVNGYQTRVGGTQGTPWAFHTHSVSVHHRENDEVWVYCVMNPVDYGRVLKIQGPGNHKLVYLSRDKRVNAVGGPGIAGWGPALGMNGSQAWVKSNTLYFMKRTDYDAIDRKTIQSADNLRFGFKQLIARLNKLDDWVEYQFTRFFRWLIEIQNEVLHPNVGRPPQELAAEFEIEMTIDYCKERIFDISRPQIDKILAVVIRVCYEKDRIAEEVPHAVDIMQAGQNIFLARKYVRYDPAYQKTRKKRRRGPNNDDLQKLLV